MSMIYKCVHFKHFLIFSRETKKKNIPCYVHVENKLKNYKRITFQKFAILYLHVYLCTYKYARIFTEKVGKD